MDLWPPPHSAFARTTNAPAAWLQSDGPNCTAFAIGAAAYVIECNRLGRDPGTPDFSFLYNNEEFLTSRIETQFVAAERRGAKNVAPNAAQPGFHLRSASRAAAVFGVPFLPGSVNPQDQGSWDVSKAPPYESFVSARRRRYDFTWLFEQPRVDPNDPALPSQRVAAPLRRSDVVRSALLAGTPVAACIGQYGRFAPGTFPRLTSPLPPAAGYHAVLIVGFFDDTSTFKFRTSDPNSQIDGNGLLDYSWVDDANATIGFTTLTPANGTIRPAVTLDDLGIANRTRSPVRVSVLAYDGERNFLGHMPYGGAPCEVAAGARVLLHPVRWLNAYRLVVTVTRSAGGSGPAQTCELLVRDPDGAVASGAEIVVPSAPRIGARGWFLRADGTKLSTVVRAVPLDGRAPTAT